MLNKRLLYCFVTAMVTLIVLHPYTVYGKPGMMVAVLFSIYALYDGISNRFLHDYLMPCLYLLLIAMCGVLSSAFHGIPQTNHAVAVISLLIVMLGARGIFVLCDRNGMQLDDFLLIVLASVVINSAIVLLEIQFDPIRQAIEAYLDPISTATIDYREGFRLRGIATSGGAGLSLAIPAAMVLALFLYEHNRLSGLVLGCVSLVLICSVVVIGRSGVVLLAVPIIAYLGLLVVRSGNVLSLLRKILVVAVVLAVIVPFFYGLILDFFTDMFGEAFVTYAFGFLLEGGEGIREEGTVSTVADFLTVLPTQWPEAFTGFGFYGGSLFYPWTDTGFNRTFLSVGFPLGILFYAILLRCYLREARYYTYIVGCFVLILCIAEAKEPLLFSGVASRMFVLFAVFAHGVRTKNSESSELSADAQPASAPGAGR